MSKKFKTKNIDKLRKQYLTGLVSLDDFKKVFFRGNCNLRNANVDFEMSPSEQEEYNRCKNDPVYFIEKYCKIKDNDGTLKNISLTESQKRYVQLHSDIAMTGERQAGMTTAIMLKCLYALLFEITVDICFVSKEQVYNAFLELLKQTYETLPYFLQQGICKYNKSMFVLENLNSIYHTNNMIGHFCNYAIFDCTNLKNDALDKIFIDIYPIVTASNGKIEIIHSNDYMYMNEQITPYFDNIGKNGNYMFIFKEKFK